MSLEKWKLRILALAGGDRYRYSRPVEGNFNCLEPGEFDWWKYKYYVRQIERAEKGSGTEQYFRTQDLSFQAGPDFGRDGVFTLTAGGDLLPGECVTPASTEHLWDDIASFYFDADVVCANLETPLAFSKPEGNAPKSGVTEAPKLNGSKEMFERFTAGGRGINFFSTANNHCLNQGESGLTDTLNFLDAGGYGHVGTARSPEERDDIPVVRKNGVGVAFLSYTFSLNGDETPPGREYEANYIRLNRPDTDLSLIRRHVRIAREKGADFVVACLHWSLEFESYPVGNVIRMGHRILEECGADVILGNHAHVIQPIERYRFRDPVSGEEKDGLIAYSLGNLVSDFNARNCRMSWILKIRFAAENGESGRRTAIDGLKILPVYTFERFEGKRCADFRLLDFGKLSRELKSGKNGYGLGKKQKKEFFTLEALLGRLLPEKRNGLLEGEDDAIIRLRGVCKTFHTKDGDVKALRNIDLDIGRGDIFGVIGYSGAGKSTLIRIVNLLERPDSGKVLVDGVSLTEVSPAELRRIRGGIGMIFQGFNLMSSIDVFSNIAAPLKNKGMRGEEIRKKVRELLKLVGLEDREHAYPNQLSGGQKQRVAIARALSSDPQILLCDEATSALDPNTTQSILQLLREIHDKLGITIVVITHQMEVVRSICNRVAVMEQGEIVEQGSIVDVFTDPQSDIGKAFVSRSIGSSGLEDYFGCYSGRIYRFRFFGPVTHRPVLSELSRRYNVTVNILFGNIENLYDTVVGSLIVEMIGNDSDLDEAIAYYKSLHTKVELIRDAR